MPEAPLEFPQLLPPLGDALLADQALNAVLDQPLDLDLTSDVPQPPTEPQPYGITWQWDYANGCFITAGGSPVVVQGTSSMKVWVQAHMNTARLAHPIYSDDYGMDIGAFPVGELLNDPATQQRYMMAVAEGLLVHDRISEVTNFDFYENPDDPGGDSMYVDFEILTDDGEITPLTLLVTD